MTDSMPILDHDRWRALSARLDDLATARADLAAQCAAARAPVKTLERLWRDALPALAGDALAAERLAALIVSAIPTAALVETARKATGLARKTKLSEEHGPGILQIGALAVLGVAAGRVAPPGLAPIYAATVHGLALQAAPAEILSRLEPHGPPRDTLGDLVARLIPPAMAGDGPDRLVLERFVYERHELGRWHCLDRAFGALGLDKASYAAAPIPLSAWSPATADRIASVERTAAGVVIHGAFEWSASDSPIALGATAITGPDGTASVAVEHATIGDLASDRIVAAFAHPVEWVGYATLGGVRTAQAVRARVREQLTQIAQQPCVGDPRLPSLISDVAALAALNEAPPRRAGNRVPPGAPQANAPAPISTSTVAIGTHRGGSSTPVAPKPVSDPERTLAVAIVRPTVVGKDGTEHRIEKGEGDKLAAAVAALVGAEPRLVELSWFEDMLAAQEAPFNADDDPRVTLILEELDRAAARVPNVQRALWIALVPEGDAGAGNDGTVRPVSLGVAHPGTAALGVAVGTPAGVLRALAALLDALARAVTPTTALSSLAPSTGIAAVHRACHGIAPRLRIVGTYENRTIRLIETPRLDDARAAGPGAPVDLGLTAVCLDAGGHELARTPIRGHRTGAAALVALPAITADVARIELRTADATVLRIVRPTSGPTLAVEWTAQPTQRGTDQSLWVGWRITAGSAHETVLEAAPEGSDDWVRVKVLPAGCDSNLVPTWWHPAKTRFRLVVTNGWHTIASPEIAPRNTVSGPYVARRVSEQLLWSELPDSITAAPTWHLPDGTVSSSRIQKLPKGASGNVSMNVGGVVDVRPIGKPDGSPWASS